jgi:hypothetical protein
MLSLHDDFIARVARVGWVEAIAETHHNPWPPDDGFRFALPILQPA